jgi:glucarate dehydratase
LEDCDLEYLEDPTTGIAGMARVRERTQTPLATNMCVTNFDDFPAAVQAKAVDVILADIYYWGGITGVKHLSRLCETFRLGLSMHSGAQFGITLSATLHVLATLPNLVYDADAHYHHLVDDIIVGGKLAYEDGCIAVPAGPGLGVQLDPDKLAFYARYYEEQGDDYAKYHADERRPNWFPINPSW